MKVLVIPDIHLKPWIFDRAEKIIKDGKADRVLSVKLDAPAPCRLDAPDLDLICYASADCLHQHLQVI